MDILPFDAGVIIIVFTIITKFILLPLSLKASRAQLQMKSTEKDLQAIKEKYKDDKEEQSRKTMEYYKEKGINPFAGFFILLVQLPILIGLYRVFLRSGLPQINQSLLYSFVKAPATINMVFLHFISISDKSLFLATIAGLTTYIQISIANSSNAENTGTGTQAEIQKAMAMQMKYFFPILIGFVAFSISSAVALYLITSNVFAIFQEMYVKRKYHKSVIAY
jgi:YidC/Oxa1 family membrane protein insertase